MIAFKLLKPRKIGICGGFSLHRIFLIFFIEKLFT